MTQVTTADRYSCRKLVHTEGPFIDDGEYYLSGSVQDEPWLIS